MLRGLRMLLATLAVAGVTVGVAAAGAGGSQKFDLLGPDGEAACDGSGVLSGHPGGFGFAVINAPSNGTVGATVSLKGLMPNTDYSVSLIQSDHGGHHGCGIVDGTITTNKQGNGNVHVSVASVSTEAFVWVCAGDTACGGGHHHHGDSYVTDTYNH